MTSHCFLNSLGRIKADVVLFTFYPWLSMDSYNFRFSASERFS
jgi:hypothetical protein